MANSGKNLLNNKFLEEYLMNSMRLKLFSYVDCF